MAESDVSSSASEYEDPDDHTYVEPSERRKRRTGPVTKQQRPRKRAPPRSASAPDPRCLEDRDLRLPRGLASAARERPAAGTLSDTSEVVRGLIALDSALKRCSPSRGRAEARAALTALHDAWMRYARVETGFELAQDFDELREGISRLESLLAELSEEAAP